MLAFIKLILRLSNFLLITPEKRTEQNTRVFEFICLHLEHNNNEKVLQEELSKIRECGYAIDWRNLKKA